MSEADRIPPLHCTYHGIAKLFVGVLWDSRSMPLALECTFAGLEEPQIALLDTASDYCVMRPETAIRLGIDPYAWPRNVRIATPHGLIVGALHRHPIRIDSVAGEGLMIEPNWFVPEDWLGPTVLGWRSFLNAIAFGCDPGARAEDSAWFRFTSL